MANVVVAYVLWLFGGVFGLHHLYLGRPRQSLIWFATWGGMVLGWIGEAGRIPEYVKEANGSSEYIKRLKEMKKASPKPELSVVFVGSCLMIGHTLANLVRSAAPEEYITPAWYGIYITHVLAALGASTGVHLVANMGPQEAPFLLPFLASACTFPASYFLHDKRPVVNMICIFVAAVISSEHAQWRKTKKLPESFTAYVKNTGLVVMGISLYCSLWSSNIYFNVRVATLNGTVIPMRVAVANFWQTAPLTEAWDAVYDLVPCARLYGLDVCQAQLFGRISEMADPERDKWAFNVLGFNRYPTQKQINSHCRKMSSKWHPDRFTKACDNEKKEAEQKFLDIQRACSMLNRIKQKRERQNKWTSSDTTNQETVHRNDDVTSESDDVCNGDDCDGTSDSFTDEFNSDAAEGDAYDGESNNYEEGN